MTFGELIRKVKEVIPDAVFDEDNEGQLIIYTNLMSDPDNTGIIVRFVGPSEPSIIETPDGKIFGD